MLGYKVIPLFLVLLILRWFRLNSGVVEAEGRDLCIIGFREEGHRVSVEGNSTEIRFLCILNLLRISAHYKGSC